MQRHDRPEELVAHVADVRIVGLDQRGLHEVALAVVAPATGEDLHALGLARLGDRGGVLVERALLDHRAHEVREVGDVSDLDRADRRDQLVLHLRPHRLRDVDARRGRALLALILVAAADDRGRERAWIRRRVREDEVLAAGLADEPRVAAVAIEVVADALPHHPEHIGRAGEVDTCELGMIEDDVGAVVRETRDEVEDARRQARLFEQLEDLPRREQLRLGGLPHDGVAHERARHRQVSRDRGEVERRQAEHEAFERPELAHVPHARRARRLHAIELLRVRHVEPPEVDQLAGGIDLGLVARLRLAVHGRGVDRHAPRPREQIGGAEQHRGARLPRHRGPLVARLERGADRALGGVLVGGVEARDHVAVAVRHANFADLAGEHALAAHDARDLDDFLLDRRERLFEPRLLGAAGRVAQDRLVDRVRNVHDRVVHGRGVPRGPIPAAL